MASYSAGDFIKALKKKGFEYQPEVTHHEYYALYYNGIKTSIYTYISHGERDFSDRLIKMRRGQLRLETNAEFRDFVNCPLSKERYCQLLIERGSLKEADKD